MSPIYFVYFIRRGFHKFSQNHPTHIHLLSERKKKCYFISRNKIGKFLGNAHIYYQNLSILFAIIHELIIIIIIWITVSRLRNSDLKYLIYESFYCQKHRLCVNHHVAFYYFWPKSFLALTPEVYIFDSWASHHIKIINSKSAIVNYVSCIQCQGY